MSASGGWYTLERFFVAESPPQVDGVHCNVFFVADRHAWF